MWARAARLRRAPAAVSPGLAGSARRPEPPAAARSAGRSGRPSASPFETLECSSPCKYVIWRPEVNKRGMGRRGGKGRTGRRGRTGRKGRKGRRGRRGRMGGRGGMGGIRYYPRRGEAMLKRVLPLAALVVVLAPVHAQEKLNA